MLRTRPRRAVTLNLTSLIDVLFILLLFFVVTTTFLDQPGIQLDLPKGWSAQQTRVQNKVLTVTRDGRIFLNQKEIPRNGLTAALRAIPAAEKKEVVLLRADRNVPYGVVIEVMDAARQAGLVKLSAVVDPGVEKR